MITIESYLSDVFEQELCEFTLIATLQSRINDLQAEGIRATAIITYLENLDHLNERVLDAISDYLIANNGP